MLGLQAGINTRVLWWSLALAIASGLLVCALIAAPASAARTAAPAKAKKCAAKKKKAKRKACKRRKHKGNGAVSGPIEIPFQIRPAPWLTGWALTLYALVIAFFLQGKI